MKKAKLVPDLEKLVKEVCDFVENNLSDVITEYIIQTWFIERSRIRRWRYKKLLNYVKKHEVN